MVKIDGAKLKRFRDERMWTLRELKDASGVAADTILDLEHGRRNANQSTIRKLAAALDIEPRELLKGDRDG
jgi:transcriptional regulator with XRE-family HTH domain